MRQATKAALGATLLSALIGLSACGSDAPTVPPISGIVVKTDAVVNRYLQSRYTCDGQNISPPIEWGAVPAGVQQLALFVLAFTPEPATKTYSITVEWAVAGLNPALHRLAAGQLPPGAYLGLANGHNRRGYSICPKKGEPVHYQFELYGEPAAASISHNFAGLAALGALTGRGPDRAIAHGGVVANYKRQ